MTVLAAYQVTRATLLDFKAGIQKMPFLRRFVAAVSIGTVPSLHLPTLALPGSQEYRDCVAGLMHKWDNAVRVPFLGHLTQELFEVFNEAEPVDREGLAFSDYSPCLVSSTRCV